MDNRYSRLAFLHDTLLRRLDRKFFVKILKQILLLISCFFSSLIVKFGEIHKLGFMSWIVPRKP